MINNNTNQTNNDNAYNDQAKLDTYHGVDIESHEIALDDEIVEDDDDENEPELIFSEIRPNYVEQLGYIRPYGWVDLDDESNVRDEQRLTKILNDFAASANRASERRRQVTSDPFAKLGLYDK